MPAATFTQARAYSGVDKVLAWVEFASFDPSTGAAHTYKWAGTTVASPNASLDGRMIALGGYTRGLSDAQGNYQGTGFAFTVSDVDQTLRTFITNFYQKYFANTEVVVKICSAADLKAGQTPIVWARGLVTDYTFLTGKQVRFSCEDELSANFRATMPRRKVDPAFFTQNIGQPEPILYGTLHHSDPLDAARNGAVQAFWVGDFEVNIDPGGTGELHVLSAFMIAGHACKSVYDLWFNGSHVGVNPTLYDDNGTFVNANMYIPGNTNWVNGQDYAIFMSGGNFAFPSSHYYDILGTDGETRRYTLVFVPYLTDNKLFTEPFGVLCRDGTVELRFSVQGTEDIGDGTGALITGLGGQAKHFLRNYVFVSTSSPKGYMTGNYATVPEQWADGTPKVDEASFDGTDLGYVGATALCDEMDVREALARWAVSADIDIGLNRQQQFMAAAYEQLAIASIRVTESDDIIDGSFQISGQVTSGFFNVAPYAYKGKYSAGSVEYLFESQELQDDGSVTKYHGKRSVAPLTTFAYVREDAQAVLLATRRLRRSADPPRLVTFLTGLHALTWELGTVLSVTHREGLGADGWVNRTVRVDTLSLNADLCTVLVTARDLGVDDAMVEEIMAVKGLSGSRDAGAYDIDANGIVDFPETRVIPFDWDTVPLGYVVTARWWGKIEGAARYTPQVWDAVAAVEVVAGTEVSSTSFPAANAPQSLVLPAATGVKYYTMRGKAAVSTSPSALCYADVRVDVEVP